MKKSINLSKKEAEIMSVFWEADEPLIISEIPERNPKLNKNTVAATIKKLLDKKCIEMDSVVYHGRVLARSFKPILTKEEYVLSELSRTNMNFVNVMSTLVKREKDIDSLEEIEAIIQKQKEELMNKEG